MFTKEDLIRECGQYLMKSEAEEAWESLHCRPQTAVRKHPVKFREFRVKAGGSVPWCEQGVYLDERPVFTLDIGFHTGEYYVQEPSSMIVGTLVQRLAGNNSSPLILDAAAAPGSKSTHILEVLNGKGVLVCNEPDGKRMKALKTNLCKSGYSNIVLTSSYAEHLKLPLNFFDIILLDAPCSGSGLFRKDNNWMNEWKKAYVEKYAMLQKKILLNLLPFLKEGGYIVYSTCSLSVQENEKASEFMMEKGIELMNQEFFSEFLSHGVLVSELGARFFAHKVRGEGFFVSVGRKTTFSPEGCSKPKSEVKEVKDSSFIPYQNSENVFVRKYKEGQIGLYYIDSDTFRCSRMLMEAGTGVVFCGLFLGTTKHSFIPSQFYAMSVMPLVTDFFKYCVIELPADKVMMILRQKRLDASGTAAEMPDEGYLLATYQSNGICWIKKQSGGKFRILLPEEFRIKSTSLR